MTDKQNRKPNRCIIYGFGFMAFALTSAMACRGYAQDVKEDRIDEEYRKCLLSDTSYANVADCSFAAFGKWDKEMNKAYNKLLDRLKKEKEKDALKQAQAAWKSYKDAEFTAYDFMFNQPGNKMSLMRAEGRIEVVRERTLQLRAYLEALK